MLTAELSTVFSRYSFRFIATFNFVKTSKYTVVEKETINVILRLKYHTFHLQHRFLNLFEWNYGHFILRREKRTIRIRPQSSFHPKGLRTARLPAVSFINVSGLFIRPILFVIGPGLAVKPQHWTILVSFSYAQWLAHCDKVLDNDFGNGHRWLFTRG